ncbi:hypothetical protein SAMN05421676_109141 [Salinibacillus kushneri]|uniref:Uncharacterized protein n=1 Tax=Salinibacillus kushneri TaxID=237682 RepID=A0A1I0HR97_9BACI|nr:DUF5325 family protein [Salinibacillus kushneri]SET86544.1 hypothetical protein SAMN05421676_109141 [Salinibacillus kushneri]
MKYEQKAFLLAVLVILCYIAVGIAIGYEQHLLSAGLFILGFFVMGLGFKMKKKQGL